MKKNYRLRSNFFYLKADRWISMYVFFLYILIKQILEVYCYFEYNQKSIYWKM